MAIREQDHRQPLYQQEWLSSLQISAEHEASRIRLTPEHFAGRRMVPGLAIDPVGARDRDDAIWVEERGDGGFRVQVSIADVAELIEEGSAIDQLARVRGFSQYIDGRAVVPMLPRSLSEDVLSLVAGEKRLTMTVDMQLSPMLQLEALDIDPTVFCSPEDVSYYKATKMMSDPSSPYYDMLQTAAGLTTMLQAQREGSAHWARFGEQVVFPRNHTMHDVVGELMILTNNALALYGRTHNLPLLYRNHHPRQAPYAYYAGDNRGHYGLNLSEYAPGSSPIRRVNDLHDWRVIKHHRAGRPIFFGQEQLETLASDLNDIEREMKARERGRRTKAN